MQQFQFLLSQAGSQLELSLVTRRVTLVRASKRSIMRVTDLFLAFPALILALTIEATLGRNVVYAIIALVVVWWPSYARLLRGETLKIKNQKFIDAALLSGLSSFGIIVKHVFRSSLNTLISYATIDLGNTILVYSILSFLGLGVPAPAPEWGTMVASGLNYFPGQWWYSMLPGIVITVIVIGAALLGDGLRDMFAGEFCDLQDSDLLRIRNLSVDYRSASGNVPALRDVSVSVKQGEILSIVGESGSGKTTLALAVSRLLTKNSSLMKSGKIIFRGKDITNLKTRGMDSIRGTRSIFMIFQNPFMSLNPLMRVRDQIREAIKVRDKRSGQKENRSKILNQVVDVLKAVRIGDAEDLMERYPHRACPADKIKE